MAFKEKKLGTTNWSNLTCCLVFLWQLAPTNISPCVLLAQCYFGSKMLTWNGDGVLHRAHELLKLLTNWPIVGASRRTISFPVSCELSRYARPTPSGIQRERGGSSEFPVCCFSFFLSASVLLCQNLSSSLLAFLFPTVENWEYHWSWVHSAVTTSCTQGCAVWQRGVIEPSQCSLVPQNLWFEPSHRRVLLLTQDQQGNSHIVYRRDTVVASDTKTVWRNSGMIISPIVCLGEKLSVVHVDGYFCMNIYFLSWFRI